jgi:lipoyl(octanoyl) transferase
MSWIFMNTGYHSGRFNMEFDEALAFQLKNNIGRETLRVYGWHPYCISLGFNQHPDDFDKSKLAQDGIDIVRRPTGGRAILHAHELTYSVVTQLNTMTPRTMYRFINEGLLAALHFLNVDATLTETDADFRSLYHDPASVPCFSSSAKSEIQFKGKKLVGSAQRRYGAMILQHGSILLGPQHRRLTDYLAPHIANASTTIEEHLLHHTTDLETILDRPVSFNEVSDAIKLGFERQCGIEFDDDIRFESGFIETPTIVSTPGVQV